MTDIFPVQTEFCPTFLFSNGDFQFYVDNLISMRLLVQRIKSRTRYLRILIVVLKWKRRSLTRLKVVVSDLKYQSTHIIIEVEEAGPVDVQNGIERMPAPGNFRHYNWVTSIWEVPKLTSKYVSNPVKQQTYQKSILEVLQDRNHHKDRESPLVSWPWQASPVACSDKCWSCPLKWSQRQETLTCFGNYDFDNSYKFNNTRIHYTIQRLDIFL